MSSRCACDHCSLSLCSGVGVADECKHWNTHFSGSLMSYFLQKFQFQHGCLLNPSPAGRKSSHFQSWVTQTQRKHWNEAAAERAVGDTGIHHSGHLYPVQIFYSTKYNGKKSRFSMSIWRNSSEGKDWALPAVLHLCFPPSVTHWEQSRDAPAASDSLHCLCFQPPELSSVFPTEEIPPQHHHSALELWNTCSVSHDFVSTKQIMMYGGKAPFNSWLHR